MKYTKFTVMMMIFVLITAVTGTVYAQDDESYVVGLINYFDPQYVIAEMAELGYIEGENVTYLFPWVENWEEMEFMDFMAEFQAQYEEIASSPDVDIFITNTDTDAVGLLPFLADPNTPIVFARSDDPVATGAVADLIMPGGNITGQVTNRPHERRLQILTEINPETDTIYYLYSTLTGEAEIVRAQVEAVGEELGVDVILAPITDVPSALALLENVPEEVDWLFLTPFVPFDLEFNAALDAVSLELGAGITGVIPQATQTWLMGYGPDLATSDAEAARTVDRILRGANPADLPVQIIENGLMINLENAELIGMEIPAGILRQSDLIVRPGDFDETGVYIGNQ